MIEDYKTVIKEFCPLLNAAEINHIITYLKTNSIDIDKIDFFAIGKSASFETVQGYLFQNYGIELPNYETAVKTPTNTVTKPVLFLDKMIFWQKVIIDEDIKSIFVTGSTGSGKTALCHQIINQTQKSKRIKKVYLYKYPDKDLLYKLKWNDLYSLEILHELRDCLIWIDEPQHYFPVYDKKSNIILSKLLVLARQRNIILLISTALTQYVTRMLESQIDIYCVKDIDVNLIKQGSRIKKIIKDIVEFDIDGFKLNKNEYIFYCRKYKDKYSGKFNFEIPKYWNDKISKPFKNIINQNIR